MCLVNRESRAERAEQTGQGQIPSGGEGRDEGAGTVGPRRA